MSRDASILRRTRSSRDSTKRSLIASVSFTLDNSCSLPSTSIRSLQSSCNWMAKSNGSGSFFPRHSSNANSLRKRIFFLRRRKSTLASWRDLLQDVHLYPCWKSLGRIRNSLPHRLWRIRSLSLFEPRYSSSHSYSTPSAASSRADYRWPSLTRCLPLLELAHIGQRDRLTPKNM